MPVSSLLGYRPGAVRLGIGELELGISPLHSLSKTLKEYCQVRWLCVGPN